MYVCYRLLLLTIKSAKTSLCRGTYLKLNHFPVKNNSRKGDISLLIENMVDKITKKDQAKEKKIAMKIACRRLRILCPIQKVDTVITFSVKLYDIYG